LPPLLLARLRCELLRATSAATWYASRAMLVPPWRESEPVVGLLMAQSIKQYILKVKTKTAPDGRCFFDNYLPH
jgi:hypothetical protein